MVAAAIGIAGVVAEAASSLTPAPVSCEPIILQKESGGATGRRVVLGVISVPPAYQPPPRAEPRRLTRAPVWPYFAKAGLAIRGGSPPVTITVPKAWRSRTAIGWGDGGGSALRIASCPAYEPNKPWNGYAGGFYLRSRSACVPLMIKVGTRSATVRFGIGRTCGAGK